MSLLRIIRSSVGTSLVTTGVVWTLWSVSHDAVARPPVGAWVVVALIGFAVLPKPWGRQASDG